PRRPSGSNRNTTSDFVLAGALNQDSAGDTFCPPHMRIGSSAAYLLVSMPPSEKEEEVTVNGAAIALAATPNAANPDVPSNSVSLPNLIIIPFAPAVEKYHHWRMPHTQYRHGRENMIVWLPAR